MKNSKYVEFVQLEWGRPKTLCWRAYNPETGASYGLIKWCSQWRRYGFYPDEKTFYDWDIMFTIAGFLENVTKEHYENRQG